MKQSKDEQEFENRGKKYSQKMVRMIQSSLKGNKNALKFFNTLETDEYIQSLLRHANRVTVERLGYNDHGPVHSGIAAKNSLRILDILHKQGIPTNVIKEKTGNYKDSQFIVLAGAYLHDIGNAVHRDHHYLLSALLLGNFLDQELPKYFGEYKRAIIKSMIIECLYSHDECMTATSIEAGCVKVGDGTDIEGGRAWVPFKKGKMDIHAVSALSIKSLEITRGKERPININIEMSKPAGIFQAQNILGTKINASNIKQYIEVTYAVKVGKGKPVINKFHY